MNKPYEGQKLTRKHKPTAKQVAFLKYRNEGYGIRTSLKKAGYSPGTYKNNGSKKIMRNLGVQMAMMEMKEELVSQGLTPQYVASKLKEWMDAKKIFSSHTEPDKEVPDYDTQIKAYDRWEKAIGMNQKDQGVKRRLTVEEFVNDTYEKKEIIEGENV